MFGIKDPKLAQKFIKNTKINQPQNTRQFFQEIKLHLSLLKETRGSIHRDHSNQKGGVVCSLLSFLCPVGIGLGVERTDT